MLLSKEYIAGFFDGEGCITIHSRNYQLRLLIGNTYINVLKNIQDTCGGRIYRNEKKKYKKLSYVWETSSNNAISFLESILPYLIVKKEEALIALDFERTKTYKKRLTQDEIDSREGYMRRLKSLKNVSYLMLSEHKQPCISYKKEDINIVCNVCGCNFIINKSHYEYIKNKGQNIFVCSSRCVGILNKKYLIPMPSISNDKINIIKEELKKGTKGLQISKRYGIGRTTVYTYIHKIRNGEI